MTGMVNSHEMLIMPTMGMKPGEEEYAVCCALPVDAPGVIHIFGRQTNDDASARVRSIRATPSTVSWAASA